MKKKEKERRGRRMYSIKAKWISCMCEGIENERAKAICPELSDTRARANDCTGS